MSRDGQAPAQAPATRLAGAPRRAGSGRLRRCLGQNSPEKPHYGSANPAPGDTWAGRDLGQQPRLDITESNGPACTYREYAPHEYGSLPVLAWSGADFIG